MAPHWCGLLCGLSFFLVVHGQDFTDTLDNPIFIYHESKSLLLTVTDRDCYYLEVSDHMKPMLTDPGNSKEIELQILDALRTESGQTHPTTLDFVRDHFRDMLADFHCLEKHVFVLQLAELTTTIAPTTTTTTQPTTTHPTTTHTTTTHPTTTHPTTTTHRTTTHPTTTHPTTTTTHPTHTTTTTTPPRTVEPVHDCYTLASHHYNHLGVDLAFLLDMGPDVQNSDLNFVKNFITNFISHFNLDNQLRVSVTQNADQPQMAFDLSTYPHHPGFRHNVVHLPTLNTTSLASTATALQFVRDHVFQPASGDRPDAPNVLVVVTDGQNMHASQHDQLVQQAHLLHGNNVYVIVIDVGRGADFHSDAGVLASERGSYVSVENYDALHTIMAHLKNILCINLFN